MLSINQFYQYLTDKVAETAGGNATIVFDKNDSNYIFISTEERGALGRADLRQIYGNYMFYFENNPTDGRCADMAIQPLLNFLCQQLCDDTNIFERVKDKVYPHIKLTKGIEDVVSTFVYDIFAEDLVISYVIDLEEGFQFITKDYMKQWGISIVELRDIAMGNLMKNKKVVPRKMNTLGQDWYLINEADNYDATRILLMDSIQGFEDFKKGKWIFTIPDRDHAIIFKNTTDIGVKMGLKKITEDIFGLQRYSVSKHFYKYEYGKVQKIE